MDSAMNQSNARDPSITLAVAQLTLGHFSAIPLSARPRRDPLDSSAVLARITPGTQWRR